MLDPARVNLGGLEYSDLSPLTREDTVNILCVVSLAAFELLWF